jgi:hypothetical protein
MDQILVVRFNKPAGMDGVCWYFISKDLWTIGGSFSLSRFVVSVMRKGSVTRKF